MKKSRPSKQSNDVEKYLAGVPEPARTALSKLRATIRDAAPQAAEVISYGIPGYKYHGYLVGFAAFKDHCSFFPGSYVEDHKKELEGFETRKGTINFAPERPLPASLVKKIVRARLKENEARVKR